MFAAIVSWDVSNVNVRCQRWQKLVFLQYHEFGGCEMIDPVFGPLPERWEVRRSANNLVIVG